MNYQDKKGWIMSEQKFRTSLTLSQIAWIMEKSKESGEQQALFKQLALLKTKAELGYTQAAYTLQPQEVKEAKKTERLLEKKAAGNLSLADKYFLALDILEAGNELSEDLKSAYDEYRYLNDIMTAEESMTYAEEHGI